MCKLNGGGNITDHPNQIAVIIEALNKKFDEPE